MHFQANLEGSLWGKTRTGSVCTFSGKSEAELAGKKSEIRRTAQGLELPGVDLERMVAEVCRGQKKEQNSTYCAGVGVERRKKTNIAELAGYKKSGGEMVRKVKFWSVMRSAPTISVRC